jgi:hypothetical protein
MSVCLHTLEDLSFCAIPAIFKYRPHSPFVMQLNLFVDQLYLRSYEKYLSMYRFLGLCFRPSCEQVQIDCDGFVSSTDRSVFDAIIKKERPFTISSIEFLRMLIALRRKRQNFQKSHFGRILRDELLVKEQF